LIPELYSSMRENLLKIGKYSIQKQRILNTLKAILRKFNVCTFLLIFYIEKYTVITEILDVIVRMLDVTKDPFHLQDVGICELSIKNSNILEIVS
jgi:hypothetical protein